jgi:hypothetical protein
MCSERNSSPTPRRAGLALLAAAALATAAAPAASADTGHRTPAAGQTAGEHGMSADYHAQMSADERGMSADEHAQMSADERGMSADEHAQMTGSEDAAPADEHAAHDTGSGSDAASGEHSSHGAEATETDRPVGLVLGGFGLVNGLVLAYAAVIRRRPGAVKRRETLARVRNAAGARTAPSTSTPSPKS